MEEKRICSLCRNNQVAHSYPSATNPDEVEYYCLECYPRLFLEGDEGKDLTECSHCGMLLSDVVKGKLVGCAHCYEEMWSGIFPLVEKMQGVRAYQGKNPNLSENISSEDDLLIDPIVEKVRHEKRCHELFVLENNARSLGDETSAERYRKKRIALGKTRKGAFEC